MFILVRIEDNIIIGCANSVINEEQGLKDGYKVFELDESEFSPDMLGKKIDSYDET